MLEHPDYKGTLQEWLDMIINNKNEQVHTITFNTKGGTSIPSIQVKHGEKSQDHQ